MRSPLPDRVFRAAARAAYGDRGVHVAKDAMVERDQEGGAFVHVTVYISAIEATQAREEG